MSKTNSSKSDGKPKKIVYVRPYEKSDGTKVDKHYRSTPDHKKD